MIDRQTLMALRGACRRIWHRHPYRIAALKRVEIREHVTNQDGSTGKKVQVFYPCGLCGVRTKTAASGKYQKCAVDHVIPVVPLDGREIDIQEFAERLFVQDPLMVLCETCHSEKTKQENAERRAHKKR